MDDRDPLARKRDLAPPAYALRPMLGGRVRKSSDHVAVMIAECEVERQDGAGSDNLRTDQVTTVNEDLGPCGSE